MSFRFNKAVENDIVPELLMIQERCEEQGIEFSNKVDVLLSCSKEKLTELLRVKRMDESVIDFVAQEDDVRVIARVIKMLNRNTSFSPELVVYIRNEYTAEVLNEALDYIHSREAYKLFEVMSIEQMKEVVNARKDRIDLATIKRFMINLDVAHMIQMRKAIKHSISTNKLKLLYNLAQDGMSADELREIRKCMESCWDEEKIQWLLKKELSKEHMSFVRKTYERTSSWPKTVFIANPQYELKKIGYIYEAFGCGLSIPEIKKCTSYDTRMCRDMLKSIECEKLNKII